LGTTNGVKNRPSRADTFVVQLGILMKSG